MKSKKDALLAKLVYIFAEKINIKDKNIIDNKINILTSMDVNDSIDSILVSLDDLLNRKLITKEDIFENIAPLLKLNSEKYKTSEDLIKRLRWIKEMNLEHPMMGLSENHKLVLKAFDSFNSLIEDKFDCYYTGGLMGYLATNHPLERYHSDLDLLINEQDLLKLKKLVEVNQDFHFVSNMDHKDKTGHEYKIVYRNTPMSIGLFLFERTIDGGIINKDYYYENPLIKDKLYVNEEHLTKDYTQLMLSNEIRYHNGIPYKMMSLESIYNSKKNSRPKDRYDAKIIKNSVNLLKDYEIDIEKRNNFSINHKLVTSSIVNTIENNNEKAHTHSL